MQVLISVEISFDFPVLDFDGSLCSAIEDKNNCRRPHRKIEDAALYPPVIKIDKIVFRNVDSNFLGKDLFSDISSTYHHPF